MKHLHILPLIAAVAAVSATPLSAKSPVPGIAEAASEPAVSAINGKLDANYGAINRSSTRGVGGTISLPVGHRFGAQFDGLYQHGFSTNIYGLGSHFFARDPSKGLLGLAVSGVMSQKFDDFIFGVEGEYYLKQVTLGAVVGYDNYNSRVPTTFPGLATHQNFVAARVYAAIYPMDNLMISLEYQSRFNHNFYLANVEWQTPINGVALFASGGVGEHAFAQLLGGVRVYFGGSKPLKDRHRKDDPSNIGSSFIGSNSGGSTDTSQPKSGGIK
ncbi:hypothetical protein [Prosthecobacter sp.]|uniref:hypothetical protein n=1 Tax=Prosthecobacter sp. TaxID=1965333 RepID=UPI003783E414